MHTTSSAHTLAHLSISANRTRLQIFERLFLQPGQTGPVATGLKPSRRAGMASAICERWRRGAC